MDIVASSRRGMYAWQSSGTPLSGWPYLISPPYNLYFTPSLADIDNDQKLEIFGGSEGLQQLGLSYNGNSLPGWPQQAAGNSFNKPTAIADVDNNGDSDIIAGTRDQFQYYPAQVYLWNHDGSILPGWPRNVGEIRVESIAVSDLDQDGDGEIIAADGRKVFVWNQDGTPFGPWPLAPQPDIQVFTGPYGGTYLNSPLGVAVGDVNNDGNQDVVVFTYNYAQYEPNKRIWVHAFNANGVELPNFPVEISGLFAELRPGIALAKLDNDDLLEIILTTTQKLVVVKASGAVQSFPQNYPALFGQIFGAVVANIDNDPERELISPLSLDNTLGTPEDAIGKIYAWNPDGTILANYPLTLPVIPTTMLSIADINGDGRPEVAGGYVTYDSSGTVTNSGIYIQKLPGSSLLWQVEWATFAHDMQHTNFYP